MPVQDVSRMFLPEIVSVLLKSDLFSLVPDRFLGLILPQKSFCYQMTGMVVAPIITHVQSLLRQFPQPLFFRNCFTSSSL